MRSALEQSRRLALPELTGRACRSRPDRHAVIFGDDVRTHAELHDRAARLASVLAAGGVAAHDRVALLLHNRIEFVEALLACHHLAAVAVPINFRLAPDEIDYVLADSGAVALICDAPVPGAGDIPTVLDVGPGYTMRSTPRSAASEPTWVRTIPRSCVTPREHPAGRRGRSSLIATSSRARSAGSTRCMPARMTCGCQGNRCFTSAGSTACCRFWCSERP
jgi:acyl-CoA synthetase (AMP-forming)/AMP-acid ligase II